AAIRVVRPRWKPQREDVLDPVVDQRDRQWRASLGLRHRPRDVFAIALAQSPGILAHVGAVYGKVGDDLGQRAGETPQGEVAGGSVLLGNSVEPVGEHVE